MDFKGLMWIELLLSASCITFSGTDRGLFKSVGTAKYSLVDKCSQLSHIMHTLFLGSVLPTGLPLISVPLFPWNQQWHKITSIGFLRLSDQHCRQPLKQGGKHRKLARSEMLVCWSVLFLNLLSSFSFFSLFCSVLFIISTHLEHLESSLKLARLVQYDKNILL